MQFLNWGIAFVCGVCATLAFQSAPRLRRWCRRQLWLAKIKLTAEATAYKSKLKKSGRRVVVYKGVLKFHSEMGEICGPVIEEEPFRGYDGLHFIKGGDYVVLYDKDAAMFWEGVVDQASHSYLTGESLASQALLTGLLITTVPSVTKRVTKQALKPAQNERV